MRIKTIVTSMGPVTVIENPDDTQCVYLDMSSFSSDSLMIQDLQFKPGECFDNLDLDVVYQIILSMHELHPEAMQ